MRKNRRILIISTVGLIYDGITSVIVSYLKAMNREGLDIYVAGTIDVKDSIRDQIEAMGCKIIDLPNRRSNTMKYLLQLSKFVRKKKIDVVHAHGNSGTLAIEMVASWLGGCKKRIAHSHNTKCDQVKADKLLRPIFNIFYTDALACGVEAGRWLFGRKKFKVLQNGRDIEVFSFNQEIRKQMRTQLNLQDEIAIGHVGGCFEQKNHRFLLQIFKEIVKIEPTAKLYLIGDGPLKETMEKRAKGITKNIIFVGTTDCVSDYLQAMDGMLLPSLFEGLPLVAVEWQLNGLPCVFSDVITKGCRFTDNVEFLSLEKDPSVWAKEIVLMIKKNNNREMLSKEAVLNANKAGFNIKNNARILRKIYLKRN